MMNNKDIHSALIISRIIVYVTIISNYFFSRFFFYQDTLCNHGYTCPFCGLRTAMYYIEHGRFLDAFNSNKLCVLVVMFFTVALIDMMMILISYLKKKKRRKSIAAQAAFNG